MACPVGRAGVIRVSSPVRCRTRIVDQPSSDGLDGRPRRTSAGGQEGRQVGCEGTYYGVPGVDQRKVRWCGSGWRPAFGAVPGNWKGAFYPPACKAPGFIQTGDRVEALRQGFRGAIDDWGQQPTECITYCAGHDNLTTWDKLLQSVPDAPLELKKRMQRFAGLLVLTSQDIGFIHSGPLQHRPARGTPPESILGAGIGNRFVSCSDRRITP